MDVRFELTTNDPWSTTPFVKALVRWATGKRLTDRLPKLSLITGGAKAGNKKEAKKKAKKKKTLCMPWEQNSGKSEGVHFVLLINKAGEKKSCNN